MDLVAPFEFATATRIIFGRGTLSQVGSIVASYGNKALLVTGKKSDRSKPIITILEKHNISFISFEVGEEPTTEIADAGLKRAREEQCNVVIGFGGGSVVDTAKAIAAVLANGGEFLDYMEVIGKGKQLTKPSIPFIAIPTTAGTGAEVTRNAVLCSKEHKQKVSLRSLYMLPAVALIDPELTMSVPASVTASTGLDAFTQVLEVFVSNKANPITDSLCREALKRAARSLFKSYSSPDIQSREDMCIVSHFGGLALANAKLGGVHGYAGVLGGMFAKAPHGAVCAALLPYVIDTNVKALKSREPQSAYLKRFEEVAQIITNNPNASPSDGVEWIVKLCKSMDIPSLQHYGVTKDQFGVIAEKSASSSSMQGNPVKLTKEELLDILEKAY